MTHDEYWEAHNNKHAATCTEEVSNIVCHIKTLIDLEWQKEIGATEDRDLHIRVMRILCDYNRLREENEQLRRVLLSAKAEIDNLKRAAAQDVANRGPG